MHSTVCVLGDKDIRGKGYGVDTVMAIMKYAFEELGLNRLDGSIIEYNKASIRLYIEKMWMERRRRQKPALHENRYWDKIILGITKEDYETLIQNNKWD